MKNIWGRIPVKIRERPFDAFTAVLLFMLGTYQLIDPNWPEEVAMSINNIIFVIISLYLMCAGIVIIVAMSLDYKKHPVYSFFGQMYGWAFMGAATMCIELITLYNSLRLPIGFYPLLIIWALAWLFVTYAAVFRSLSLWLRYKKVC